jgi:hypothetical protein
MAKKIKEKDTRYTTIKDLIEQKFVTSLSQIFDRQLISKSRVARDLGLNPSRFSRNLKNPGRFILKDLYALAKLLEIDGITILTLVANDYEALQKGKPRVKKGK